MREKTAEKTAERPAADTDYSSIPEDMAHLALLSQTACNASGLIHELSKIVTRLWDQANRESRGTDWVNRHPVVVLFVAQLSHLSRGGSWEAWETAVRRCEAAAGKKLSDF